MPVLLPGDPWAFYQGSFQNNNSHVLSNTRNDSYGGNLRPNRGTSPHLGDGKEKEREWGRKEERKEIYFITQVILFSQ